MQREEVIEKTIKLYQLYDEENSTMLLVRHYNSNHAVKDFCSDFIGEDYRFFKSGKQYKVRVEKGYEGHFYGIRSPQLADEKRGLRNGLYGWIEGNCDECNDFSQLNCEDGEHCLCSKCL